MHELRTDLLIEYVDEQTPGEAPPFEFVEQAVRRQRRTRGLVATAAAVLFVGGAVVATATVPRAEEPATPPTTPTAPAVGLLDDGPPPKQFKFGNTVMLLGAEVPVSRVEVDSDNAGTLIVEAPRTADDSCVPHTMVRILSQDASTVRIAAYRYFVAPDQPESQLCVKPGTGPLRISLDLRRQVGNRTVLAGSTGNRAVLN